MLFVNLYKFNLCLFCFWVLSQNNFFYLIYIYRFSNPASTIVIAYSHRRFDKGCQLKIAPSSRY